MPIQAYVSMILHIPVQSCLVYPIPAYYSLFQSIPVYSSLLQPIPPNSSIFQHIPAYSSLFQPILAYASLFPNIRSPIPNPESPIYNLKCPIVHFIPNRTICLLVLQQSVQSPVTTLPWGMTELAPPPSPPWHWLGSNLGGTCTDGMVNVVGVLLVLID